MSPMPSANASTDDRARLDHPCDGRTSDVQGYNTGIKHVDTLEFGETGASDGNHALRVYPGSQLRGEMVGTSIWRS